MGAADTNSWNKVFNIFHKKLVTLEILSSKIPVIIKMENLQLSWWKSLCIVDEIHWIFSSNIPEAFE